MEKIKIRTIVELMGTPKEHVEETMEKVIDLIQKKDYVTLIKKDIAEIKQVETIWSTFGEFEILVPDIDKLTDFCFEFMPSSIEILEPDILKIDAKKLEGSFNDILAKFHKYDMALKRVILQQRANEKKEG